MYCGRHVQVRFSHISADAMVEVGARGMPTVANFYRHLVEGILGKVGIKRHDRRQLSVLRDVSGVLKPVS